MGAKAKTLPPIAAVAMSQAPCLPPEDGWPPVETRQSSGFREHSGGETDDLKVIPSAKLPAVEDGGDEQTAQAPDLDSMETRGDDARVRAEVIEKIKAWRWKSMRITALDYFAQHIAYVPKHLRPYSHEVRWANLPFYEAIKKAQNEAGASIGDLFEKMPGAQGLGAKVAANPVTAEEALARVERKRQAERDRRSRLKVAASPRFRF